MEFWSPFEESVSNQCHMDRKTYCLTQSVCSLGDMDDCHDLSSSPCPPSPQYNGELEQVAASTPAQDLTVDSGAFSSTPGISSTVQEKTLSSYDYRCESSAKSSEICHHLSANC